jgi:predicted ATP-grasp superfamily ATP-dependent carboligase
MAGAEFAWKDTPESGTTPSPGGIVLSSFPSAGLAATVAGHYMVRTLQLPRVGVFEGDDTQPIAVVQGGQVHPPIRVYGRPGLSLVLSELPVSPDASAAVARAILRGAAARKARMIIGLEGVLPHPLEDEAAGPPAEAATPEETVWFATSHSGGPEPGEFERARVRRLEDGVIGGVSGSLLVEGITQPTPVSVLLVSARNAPGGLADHLAGATLIETLDRLLPDLKIDTAPLRSQAAVIEKAIRQALKTRARPSPELPPPEPGAPAIYG